MKILDEKTVTVDGDTIEVIKIKHDNNGNPRYVVHFLDIIPAHDMPEDFTVNDIYALAVKKANMVGGRKYNTKGFSGGIVFSTYGSLQEWIVAARKALV